MSLLGERYAIEWDLEKLPPLGKGSFGVVFRVQDTVLETECALKRMPSVFDSFDDTKRVLRELRLLRLMNHDSILSVTDAFLEIESWLRGIVQKWFLWQPIKPDRLGK